MSDRILWNVLCFADQRVFFLSFLNITKVQAAGNPFSGNPNNAVNHLDEIGAALVGRPEEEQKKYDEGRNNVLPELILTVARDS